MSRPLSALYNALLLMLLVTLGVGLTVSLQHCSAPRVTAAQQAAQQRALLEVVPGHVGPLREMALDASPLANRAELLGHRPPRPAFIAHQAGKPSALILQVQAPDGYGGPIDLLVGVSAQGHLLGLKVVVHGETPSLGGRIETGDWLQGLVERARQSLPEGGWALKQDQGAFDQISGATLTSRAVVQAVQRALHYADAQRGQLFSASAPGATP
ncbi:MAG: RnfABCDGE type electron transport complex subunit G [Pseudomonadota bacterium]